MDKITSKPISLFKEGDAFCLTPQLVAIKDYITNKFAFVPFNADENEKLENPLSNSLVYYMSNDLGMGNDFDAFPEAWGLNTSGATIQEQLFTNPDQWDENTIRTGVEDALTKWKDSIKE